jgi:chromosome segregation ATPase
LIEHLKTSAENGEQVTQKEVTALKKALNDAQAKSKELEEQTFDARQALEKLKIERDKAKEREKEAREKRDQFAQDLIEADKQRKAMERELSAKLKDQQQALKDAEEVHREHLEEMRKRISDQERNRPRTDAEEAEHQSKLRALQEEAARAQTALNQAAKAKSDLERELNDLRKEVTLRDKVLNDWGTASIGFREVALRLTGSTDGLKRIPLTDELYTQIKTIRELASAIVAKLDEVTHVG